MRGYVCVRWLCGPAVHVPHMAYHFPHLFPTRGQRACHLPGSAAWHVAWPLAPSCWPQDVSGAAARLELLLLPLISCTH